MNLLPKDILQQLFLYFEPEELDKYIKDKQFQYVFDNYFWQKIVDKIKTDKQHYIDNNYHSYLVYLTSLGIYLKDSIYFDCFGEVCYGLAKRKNWSLLERLIDNKPKGIYTIYWNTLYILLWERKIDYLLKLQEIDHFLFTSYQLFESLKSLEIKGEDLFFDGNDITCLTNKRELRWLKNILLIYDDKFLEKRINWKTLPENIKLVYFRATFMSKYQTYVNYFIELDCKYFAGITVNKFLDIEDKKYLKKEERSEYEKFVYCKYF
jgi:hypothetical protein